MFLLPSFVKFLGGLVVREGRRGHPLDFSFIAPMNSPTAWLERFVEPYCITWELWQRGRGR